MADARDVLDGWNRKWRTLWCWSQLYIGYKAAQARGRLLSEDKRDEFWAKKHSHLAEMVWSNIAELRGWWVKVGQFLSTRSDLLPAQYITHLAKLQDMMPTSEFSVVKKIVETELGCPLCSIFSEFQEKAMASASIAQVHKARLRDSNTYVVVKVQHPGVDRTLRQDMLTLTQMTWAFGFLERGLNVGPVLDEWQKAAADELDFRIEMQRQEQARRAVEASGIDVIVPKPYPELTTKRVMVMEYCEGFKITDMKKIEEYNVDTNIVMDKICRSFAYQIHVDGMFNGDPHPGNILVQIDPETREPRPVLLDWGLVKCFSQNEKIAFAKAVYCVANLDVMGLMAAFEDMGFKFKSDSVIDPELYMDALRIGFFSDTGNDNSEINSSAVAAVRDSGISKKQVIEQNPIDDWPKDIIFFIRVASLLHGLCLQLHAKVPFLQLLVTRAEQCLCERHTPQSLLAYAQYPPISSSRINSFFEWTLFCFLRTILEEEQLILGCQVAVYKGDQLMADVCVGQMGPTDTRPVDRKTLFPLMTGCNGLLATAILRLVSMKKSGTSRNVNSQSAAEDTRPAPMRELVKNSGTPEISLSLDDPLCHWWDGFIRFGKDAITVRDALSHRAGLHCALPKDLTLSVLTDNEAMVSLLENALLTRPYKRQGGRYAYLTSGWIFGEIIRSVTGMRVNDYFHSEFVRKLGLSSEMFYPVPKPLLHVINTPFPRSENRQLLVQKGPPPSSTVSTPVQLPLGLQDTCSALNNLEPKHIVAENTPLKCTSSPMGNQTLHTSQSSPAPALDSTNPAHANDKKVFRLEIELDALVREHCQPSCPSTSSAGANTQLMGSTTTTQLPPTVSTALHSISGAHKPAVAFNETFSFGDNKPSNVAGPAVFVVPSTENSTMRGTLPVPHTSQTGKLMVTTGTVKDAEVQFTRGAAAVRSPLRITERSPSPIAPLGVENGHNVQEAEASSSSSDLVSRFSSTCRPIGAARIDSQEVMEKLRQVQNELHRKSDDSGRWCPKFPFPSKYLYKIQSHHTQAARTRLPSQETKIPVSVPDSSNAPPQAERVGAIAFAKSKPHVVDPLIYDSRRLQHLVIPPANCRTTARALARFYVALAKGKLVSREVLKEASMLHTVDTSLDSLILTGGGSRLFGLGYQLYPCVYSRCCPEAKCSSTGLRRVRPVEPGFTDFSVARNTPKRRITFSRSPTPSFSAARLNTGNGYEEGLRNRLRGNSTGTASSIYDDDTERDGDLVVVGLGHGDSGGSIGLCFPDLQLSVAILVNDVLTGPAASQKILNFILNCFHLRPLWDIPYPCDTLFEDMHNLLQKKSLHTDSDPSGTSRLRPAAGTRSVHNL